MNTMKVLFINTSENTGGAAVAANRLMEALIADGITAQMLVMHKSSDKPHVIIAGSKTKRLISFLLERITIWANNLFSRKNLFKISIANTGVDVTSLPEFKSADIIHLHWINQGMLSLNEIRRIIKTGKPIVWTMHDMWECTSICHHAYECDKFKYGCSECQYLRFPSKKDLSYKVFRKKLEVFADCGIHFVAVSSWLKKQAEQSRILKGCSISVIPNTLSTDDFTIFDKKESRRHFSLPEDSLIILFGAARIDDPIKGLDILIDSIKYLTIRKPEIKDRLHLVMFGNIKNDKLLSHIPISYTCTGNINSTKELSILYSAADVMVSASHYETFGQTLIEAQACGCLPVSFGNSGQSDIIEHLKNGYLAKYLSKEDLAEGILWAFENKSHITKDYLRSGIKEKYDISTIAEAYSKLYKTLIKHTR